MNSPQNGNDYYKKMLELQERLRKSEEERIRLEERFSLLEHESRSRHETCINRLRMRYIEFLEEQQARDERNHKLLGALDRVDSSLALMSAKTDRLGALRKQYEASILSGYNNNNNRGNGSLTGDSGVASQNEEKQRRINNAIGGKMTKKCLPDRGNSLFLRDKSITGPARAFTQVRSDPCYANWTPSRYQSSQTIDSPIGSTQFHSESRASRIDKNFEPQSSRIGSVNSASLINPSKSCIDRETVLSQSSPNYYHEYRFNSLRFATPEYSIKRPEVKNYSSNSRHVFDRPVVIRDLENSGAYESCKIPSRSFLDSGEMRASIVPKIYTENGDFRTSDDYYSKRLKDRLIQASNPTPYTRVADILRRELGDEEESVGNIVENELERYISKIRNLHRENDPQSVEELDHEQNTSGDLLNVTLSDDGLDFSVEDKSLKHHRATLPQNIENVLALATNLANRTATSANNLANNAYREEIVDNERESVNADLNAKRIDKDSSNIFNEDFQLTSVNAPLKNYDDETRDLSKTNFSALAKNDISAEVAKTSAELAARPRNRNIEDVAKSSRNSREICVNSTEINKIHENDSENDEGNKNGDKNDDRDKSKLMETSAASLRKLDDAYRLVIGEERETNDYLRDIAEDLEPWNINALERRVQEIILNDEAQDDFIRRDSDLAADSSIIGLKDEQIISDIREKSSVADKSNEIFNNETILVEESIKSDEDYSRENLKHNGDEDSNDNEANEESPEQQTREQENFIETLDYGVNDDEKNYINQEAESYAQGEEYPQQDSNPQYEYQENSNAQYQNYDPNNMQYDPNAQYTTYDDQQYGSVYNNDDPNAHNQNQYAEDPNQANYLDGANQQYVDQTGNEEYAIDSNQEYVNEVPNYEGYVVDPNNEEFSTNIEPQQYQQQQEQNYIQDESEAYPVSSADYVYPEGQEYATAEVYEPNQAQFPPVDGQGYVEGQTTVGYESDGKFNDDPNRTSGLDEQPDEIINDESSEIPQKEMKKPKDVIKSILDSDTESTIEKNVSNTESDFDFN